MTNEEVIRLLKIEHTCSQVNCDRNCSKCSIVHYPEWNHEEVEKGVKKILQ